LLLTYLLNKENFITYFSFGNISAPAQELKIFGIKSNDTWLQTGLSLSLVISIATGIFMYLQLKQSLVNWTLLSSGFIWIILFSLSNSFAEEMIFRMGIVSPLKGLLSPMVIYTISAVLFGLPHFAGMPNGIVGATMAGVLGFVLAKSLYETNGFFWAWLIHFLQDVLIIGGIYLSGK
jgi:membrane protease YdiL (CAAX protease family)